MLDYMHSESTLLTLGGYADIHLCTDRVEETIALQMLLVKKRRSVEQGRTASPSPGLIMPSGVRVSSMPATQIYHSSDKAHTSYIRLLPRGRGAQPEHYLDLP